MEQQKRVRILNKIRNICLQLAEEEKARSAERSFYTGMATGIQLAIHGDLPKLLGDLLND